MLSVKVCLNVVGKPDALSSWDGLLDLQEQDVIREDCRKQASRWFSHIPYLPPNVQLLLCLKVKQAINSKMVCYYYIFSKIVAFFRAGIRNVVSYNSAMFLFQFVCLE